MYHLINSKTNEIIKVNVDISERQQTLLNYANSILDCNCQYLDILDTIKLTQEEEEMIQHCKYMESEIGENS